MLSRIAEKIKDCGKTIFIIYGFNGVGKTRLSMEYAKLTNNENERTCIYYNTYSEDIFNWKNMHDTSGDGVRLYITKTNLNKYHSTINEDKVKLLLEKYNFKFNFKFAHHTNSEDGIDYIYFFQDDSENIKISRGEEHIFIWCFYQCLFDNALEACKHFFIDDPVCSLDENNIFKVASDIYNIVERYVGSKKIIITTHNVSFCNILIHWLERGKKEKDSQAKDKEYNHQKEKNVKDICKLHKNIKEEEQKVLEFREEMKSYMMKNKNGRICMKSLKNSVILYHLAVLEELKTKKEKKCFKKCDFILVRQLLENISSFLGSGRTSDALKKIGIEDDKYQINVINSLSHKNIFDFGTNEPTSEEIEIFENILGRLNEFFLQKRR